MTLPRPKKRRLINKTKFIRLAKKVNESFKEEYEYLWKKNLEYGDKIPPHSPSFS
ncbi:MAG: hypothetical protein UV73_C0003G0196 [Candidatus Gottesmanbacteria bacterium GW2011_GWA2_43_14]|uniref:Uncharacterized protein n=1 Tax=Candidatus Gottesmanbacteria bacterium GW2011_GWA2_43_14 TaxID=1618443 RepID=A0A0G1DKS6_9BACT|nr:MAG: hypothetical protein UV73_C0003G0196 [Candidatus Gottesmanbacteria bacterium GW2011_GWA2_43_14]